MPTVCTGNTVYYVIPQQQPHTTSAAVAQNSRAFPVKDNSRDKPVAIHIPDPAGSSADLLGKGGGTMGGLPPLFIKSVGQHGGLTSTSLGKGFNFLQLQTKKKTF